MKDAEDDNTASTAKLTALDSDEEESDLSDSKDGAQENRPRKGPATILYEGDSRLTRALVTKEDRALERTRATTWE